MVDRFRDVVRQVTSIRSLFGLVVRYTEAVEQFYRYDVIQQDVANHQQEQYLQDLAGAYAENKELKIVMKRKAIAARKDKKKAVEDLEEELNKAHSKLIAEEKKSQHFKKLLDKVKQTYVEYARRVNSRQETRDAIYLAAKTFKVKK